MKSFFHPLRINLSTLIFCFLLFAGIGLRFYRLNEIPYGFYWDEAAITYNAFGIAQWNRDEFGTKLPASFRSFGDYKAPLLIYLLGITYKVTGLRPELLRLVIALFGSLNVIFMYWLARSLFRLSRLPLAVQTLGSFWAMAGMALSPWAIHFSRFGVEANVAVTLILIGTISFLTLNRTWWGSLLAGFCFSLSLYAYHSSKIFTPLWVLILLHNLIMHRGIFAHQPSLKPNRSRFFYAILVAGISLVLLIPLAKDALFGQGLERSKNLIFYENGHFRPLLETGQVLATHLLSTFKPEFWLQGQDSIGLRHGVPGQNPVYYSFLACAVLGLIQVRQRGESLSRLFLFGFLIAWLPSILSQDHPHAIRALLCLPFFFLLSSVGFITFYRSLPTPWWQKVSLIAIIFILLLESSRYLYRYYGEYAIASARAFQYGYKEAIQVAETYGKTADTIVVTTAYGQPYIYTLLYRGITPEEYRFGALANYAFHEISWPDPRPRRVYVATPTEIPPDDKHVVRVITIPHTDIITFVIAKT